jgi:hypothetical protein
VRTEVIHFFVLHTTLTTPQAEVEPALASAPSPSAQQLPRPQLVVKLRPPLNTANIGPAKGNSSHNSPPPAPGPTADPRPSAQVQAQEPGMTPTDTTPHNIHLENAWAAIEKKQKPDNKLPSASTKKQKIVADDSSLRQAKDVETKRNERARQDRDLA